MARVTGSKSEFGVYLEKGSIWGASSLKSLSVIRRHFLSDTTLISFFFHVSRSKPNDEPSRSPFSCHPRSRES